MTQREVAIKCMQKLNIYKPYIKAFENGTITLFERFGGYYITEDQEPELLNKIKEFEEETGSIVYAVTHERFEFGECYSFLIVSKYDEEWEMTLEEVKDEYAFAYVWNKTDEWCSEYGTIGVKSFGGGIARTA
jgi:predicted 3-demethylubiquinone-9 3-methyltransferase (glyoxalase superfamily)